MYYEKYNKEEMLNLWGVAVKAVKLLLFLGVLVLFSSSGAMAANRNCPPGLTRKTTGSVDTPDPRVVGNHTIPDFDLSIALPAPLHWEHHFYRDMSGVEEIRYSQCWEGEKDGPSTMSGKKTFTVSESTAASASASFTYGFGSYTVSVTASWSTTTSGEWDIGPYQLGEGEYIMVRLFQKSKFLVVTGEKKTGFAGTWAPYSQDYCGEPISPTELYERNLAERCVAEE